MGPTRKAVWSLLVGTLALLLAGLGASVGRAREAATRDFSAAEQTLLREGKLVMRHEQLTRGQAHYIGGLSWQVVNADADQVWAIVADSATYKHYLPAVAETKRLERVGNDVRLWIHHETPLIDTEYCVLTRSDAATRTFSFRLDHTRPAAIDDAWGELHVAAYGDGKSVVSLALMADLGSGFVARLLRSQINEWMLRIPEQLERYVARKQRERAYLARH